MSAVKYSVPEKEIDVCLKKFNKIELIGSVKWTSLKNVDLAKVKKNLDLRAKNKFLFVKEKQGKGSLENIEIYDEKDLLKFCK